MLRKCFTILAAALFFSMQMGYAHPIVSTLDQVFVTTDGIYVASEGEYHAVESLSIETDGSILAAPRRTVEICPICGSDGYVSGRFCPNCGFPDDSSIQ